MCGRARLSSDVSEIKLVFSIPPHRPTPNIAPSWNVAPTDPLPVVRHDARVGERSLDVMRWGLVPFWAKDIKVGFANINAKAEGIEVSRPSAERSSKAAAARPCVIRTAACQLDGFLYDFSTGCGSLKEARANNFQPLSCFCQTCRTPILVLVTLPSSSLSDTHR